MNCKNWYSIFRTLPGHAALHGNVDDSSAYVFAVKPRAFGAPQSGVGLDARRSEQVDDRAANATLRWRWSEIAHAFRTMSDR
jgi:hypothetical protein